MRGAPREGAGWTRARLGWGAAKTNADVSVKLKRSTRSLLNLAAVAVACRPLMTVWRSTATGDWTDPVRFLRRGSVASVISVSSSWPGTSSSAAPSPSGTSWTSGTVGSVEAVFLYLGLQLLCLAMFTKNWLQLPHCVLLLELLMLWSMSVLELLLELPVLPALVFLPPEPTLRDLLLFGSNSIFLSARPAGPFPCTMSAMRERPMLAPAIRSFIGHASVVRRDGGGCGGYGGRGVAW